MKSCHKIIYFVTKKRSIRRLRYHLKIALYDLRYTTSNCITIHLILNSTLQLLQNMVKERKILMSLRKVNETKRRTCEIINIISNFAFFE